MLETKCGTEAMKETRNKAWKGCETMVVDAQGTTRGSAILWHPEEVNLRNFQATKGLIYTNFHICNTQVKGTLTNVYGPSIYPQKVTFIEALSWEEIWVGGKNWILGGYFNFITSLGEKKGGQRILGNANEAFKDFIEENNMVGVET